MSDVQDGSLEGLGRIVLPARRVERACSACDLSAKEGNDRVCRARPPTVQMFMVPAMMPGPGGRPQQGMQITSQTGFPVMRDDQWCGEFRRKSL